jgi:predicted nuclease of predicted toxin-antitoxin system
MRFLVDAQLPRSICPILSEGGHDVVHVKHVLPQDATDDMIWRFALESDRSILSKDEDFARRAVADAPAPRIVWLRIGNCSNAALRAKLLPLWPKNCTALSQGEALVEIV